MPCDVKHTKHSWNYFCMSRTGNGKSEYKNDSISYHIWLDYFHYFEASVILNPKPDKCSDSAHL